MCTACNWEGVLEQIEEDMALLPDLPDAADDFRDGVAETMAGIRDWVKEKHHVTERQMIALSNISAGIQRWGSG